MHLVLLKALKLEKDPKREQAHRLRLASVLTQCPQLKQLWFHKAAVTALPIPVRMVSGCLTGSDDRMRLAS